MDLRETMEEDRAQFEWDKERGGGFKQTLAKAITVADCENLQRLFKGFPHMVNGYVAFSHGVDWYSFIQMMVDNGAELLEEE